MHSYQIRSELEYFLHSLDRYAPFVDAVAIFSKYANDTVAVLEGFAESSNRFSDTANQVHSRLAGFVTILPKINNSKFFKAKDQLIVDLQSLSEDWVNSPNELFIVKIAEAVEQVSELYDTYLSQQQAKKALPLIFAAQRLDAHLRTFFSMIRTVVAELESSAPIGSDEGELSLVLPGEMAFGDFLRRLQALKDIYTELCNLFSVDEGQHPLRIGKIESGSLWARLFGETKIIALIVEFIGKGAGWLYRRNTIEGRSMALPRKVEEIDAIIGLSERMKAAGFNTDEMKTYIEKSGIAISKELSVLLAGQSSVTVNTNTISAATELPRYIAAIESTPHLAVTDETDHRAKPALPDNS